MVEELLAARSIDLTYETVRRWSVSLASACPPACIRGAGRRGTMASEAIPTAAKVAQLRKTATYPADRMLD